MILRALATLAALAVPFATPAAAEIVWHAATEYPSSAMPGEGLNTFAGNVQIYTKGQIRIEPAFDGPDGLRSATIPAAVEAGKIEVGDAFSGALGSLSPVFDIPTLPFLATNNEETKRLYLAAKPRYQQVFAAHHQHLLYVTPWPATGLWSRKPLDRPDALKGLVVRTYDATSTAVFRDAGATPVQYSFADLTPHLKDGSVDAILTSGDGGAGRKLWDYTPNFTQVGYAMPLSFTTVSDQAWNALTPEQRKQVDAAAAETEEQQWRTLRTRADRNEWQMRQNNVSIAIPSEALQAALSHAAQPAIARWRAQAGDDAAILDAYRR